jgi:hypothetical protein
MSRTRRPDRAATHRAWVARQSVHYQAMPDEDRGLALAIMVANAFIVTFLNAVLAVLVARAAHRSWRGRRLGLVAALRAGPRGTLLWVAAAMVLHQQVTRRLVLRAMERRGLVLPQSAHPGGDEPTTEH